MGARQTGLGGPASQLWTFRNTQMTAELSYQLDKMEIDVQPRDPQPVEGTLSWLGQKLKKTITGQIYALVGEMFLAAPLLILAIRFTDTAWVVIPTVMALVALNAGAIFDENNVKINYQASLEGFGRDVETPNIPLIEGVKPSGHPLVRLGFLLMFGKSLYLLLLTLISIVVASWTGVIGVIVVAFVGEYTERWLNQRDKSLIFPGIRLGWRLLDGIATTGRERLLNQALTLQAGFLLQSLVSGQVTRISPD
jgi:hypothetical protein